MFVKLFILAVLNCGLNSLANMFWKLRFNKIPLSVKSVEDIKGLVFSLNIWSGIGCYVCSMLIFFYMLSNFKLSSIMPVMCMTYIFNMIIAKVVFHEIISKTQILGTLVIILGLIILSRGTVTK